MSEEFPTPASHCRCGKSAVCFRKGPGCTCALKALGVALSEEPHEVEPQPAQSDGKV